MTVNAEGAAGARAGMTGGGRAAEDDIEAGCPTGFAAAPDGFPTGRALAGGACGVRATGGAVFLGDGPLFWPILAAEGFAGCGAGLDDTGACAALAMGAALAGSSTSGSISSIVASSAGTREESSAAGAEWVEEIAVGDVLAGVGTMDAAGATTGTPSNNAPWASNSSASNVSNAVAGSIAGLSDELEVGALGSAAVWRI